MRFPMWYFLLHLSATNTKKQRQQTDRPNRVNVSLNGYEIINKRHKYLYGAENIKSPPGDCDNQFTYRLLSNRKGWSSWWSIFINYTLCSEDLLIVTFIMAENPENNSLVVNEGRTSESGVFSRGLRRQFETFVQIRKLSVRKILLVFAGGFCALLLGLIIFILSSNFNSDRPNRVNVSDQTWYKDPGVYEIITESFKDTSPKAEDGLRKEGQGVGDIRGK